MSPKNLRKYSSQALGTTPGIENPNFWDPLERPGDALNLIANCNIWLIFKEDRITAKVYSQLAKGGLEMLSVSKPITVIER